MSTVMKMFGCGLVIAVIGATTVSRPAAQERGRGGALAGEVRGQVKSVDASAGKITVSTGGGRDGPGVETTYSLAKDVEIAVGASFGRGNGVYKEGKLADLVPGTAVSLSLSAGKDTVESIVAEEPVVHATLKTVDAANNTLTTTSPARGRGQGAEEQTYLVSRDAQIVIDDGRGTRFSLKEAKLADLAQGALVTLHLSLDRKAIHSVLAEGPAFEGTVKETDAAKKTLTLIVGSRRGDDIGEAMTFQVPEDAVILLDDGRGRRLSVKPAKLGDVPARSSASVRLTPDQQFATSIRVQGATFTGLLRAVDAGKGLVTIAIPRGRGQEPDEKTFTLARDVRVTVDGTPSTVADLKIDSERRFIQLWLTLDQKSVQSVMLRSNQGR